MQQCIYSPKKTKEHMQSKKQLAHLHVLVGMIRYAYVQIRRALLCISRTICRRPTCPAIPRRSPGFPIFGVSALFLGSQIATLSRTESDADRATAAMASFLRKRMRELSFRLSSPCENHKRQRKAAGGWCRCFPVFVQLSSAFRSFTLLAAGRQAR